MAKRLKQESVRQRLREDIIENNFTWNPIGYSTYGLTDWSEPWVLIREVTLESNRHMSGKFITDIARTEKVNPLELVFDILAEGDDPTVACFLMDEPDVKRFVAHPAGMIGTDAAAYSRSSISELRPHPRCIATFPRVLSEFVREKKVLNLPEAIHKITALPAGKLGLSKRGIIDEGYYADLVVFDPLTIKDRATFTAPWDRSEGIKYVIVNGRLVVKKGTFTGETTGRVLKSRN